MRYIYLVKIYKDDDDDDDIWGQPSDNGSWAVWDGSFLQKYRDIISMVHNEFINKYFAQQIKLR